MTTIKTELTLDQQRTRDALAERLFRTCLNALDIWGVYLGHHLGYYAALNQEGAATSIELAAATGTDERYTREWLEQQAATGILTVDDPTIEATGRRYRLEPGHADVLLDADSLQYLVPLVRYYVATNALIPRLLDVYRNGGGIPWTEMGDEIRQAQEGFNRSLFLQLLGTETLPAIPDVDARLRADPPAKVVDIGTGAGWGAIAIAKAYPKVLVDGFDFDQAVIDTARRNAAEAKVADRVRFEVHHADSPALDGNYDLATFLECVHDLSHPIEALTAARRQLAPGGTVLVMDERAADTFSAPADDIDRMFYGWSIVQCLPGGKAEQRSAETGAVMRPAVLRQYAQEAGFRRLEVLPIDNDPMRRWYQLIP